MTVQAMVLVFTALISVVVLIVAAAKVFQVSGWRPRQGPARTLILRESIALDPRRRVHLVQCGERRVILLTGGGQDVVVGWMQDP